MWTLFTFAFPKRPIQYLPPNAYQEVSNTNHFGSISHTLGRLAAASQSMANFRNYIPKFKVRIYPKISNPLKFEMLRRKHCCIPGTTTMYACPFGETFSCDHFESICADRRCDGVRDCYSGLDEENCYSGR